MLQQVITSFHLLNHSTLIDAGSWQDEYKGNKQAHTVAPYGTSQDTNDWSTSNRPVTAQQDRPKSALLKDKGKAAGISSWPESNKSNAPVPSGQDKTKDGEKLIEIFRDKVVARGSRGIFSLGRLFRIIDDDESRSLSPTEFYKVIKDFRMDINESDAKLLFSIFDTDGDGSIVYDEFLRAVRGPMNDNRKKFVAAAFKKLDKNGDGEITIDEIRSN